MPPTDSDRPRLRDRLGIQPIQILATGIIAVVTSVLIIPAVSRPRISVTAGAVYSELSVSDRIGERLFSKSFYDLDRMCRSTSRTLADGLDRWATDVGGELRDYIKVSNLGGGPAHSVHIRVAIKPRTSSVHWQADTRSTMTVDSQTLPVDDRLFYDIHIATLPARSSRFVELDSRVDSLSIKEVEHARSGMFLISASSEESGDLTGLQILHVSGFRLMDEAFQAVHGHAREAEQVITYGLATGPGKAAAAEFLRWFHRLPLPDCNPGTVTISRPELDSRIDALDSVQATRMLLDTFRARRSARDSTQH